MDDWYESETAQVPGPIAGEKLNHLDDFDLRDAVPIERTIRLGTLAFF